MERELPDLRIINLETAITTSGDAWESKGIHYRMNPENGPCLTAASIDCSALANNHLLDWGYAGLEETLETLQSLGVKSCGAGRTRDEARQPAVFDVADKGRVILFSFGSESSGVPIAWAARDDLPGVNLLDETSRSTLRDVQVLVERANRPGDIVVASIHWGENSGYEISPWCRELAHCLIDHAGVDVIHAHSSHHVKGVEVYKQKPIIYGCGDFLNDYEGISRYRGFRDDLGLM